MRWAAAASRFTGFDPDWAEPTYKIVRIADRGLRAGRGVSLHSRIGLRRVQGRLAVHRHRLLARIVVGDLQHHRRLHDDVPAGVEGRRSRQDRRRLRRRHRDAAAGHPPPVDQERRDHHPELADPGERGPQLQLAGADARPHPAHRGRHRLRDAVAAGGGDADGGRGAHAGTLAGASSVRARRRSSATSR